MQQPIKSTKVRTRLPTGNWRRLLRVMALIGCLGGAGLARATDLFDGTYLIIPLVMVGSTGYTHVVVTVGSVHSVLGGQPTSSSDYYDGKYLNIPSVLVGSNTYNNVQITIGSLVSVSSSGTAFYDVDALGVPQFVDTSHVDITQKSGGQPVFKSISLFRSSEGHDYSDTVESCRSMKHYFNSPNNSTPIVSPVNGSILSLTPEQNGQGLQVHIVPQQWPAFQFILFHVSAISGVNVGTNVAAGQTLGTASGGTDIAVAVLTSSSSYRLVSFFQTLTDTGFQPYAASGITSRNSLSLTQSQRDANPLSCVFGQGFTNNSNFNDPLPKEIGLVAPTAQLEYGGLTTNVPAGSLQMYVSANQPFAVSSWTISGTQTNSLGNVLQSNVAVANGGVITSGNVPASGGSSSTLSGTPVTISLGGSAGDTFVYTLTITDTRGLKSSSQVTLTR